MIEVLQHIIYQKDLEQKVFWDITNEASEAIAREVEREIDHAVAWQVMHRISDRYEIKGHVLDSWRKYPHVDYATEHILRVLQ